MKTQSTGAEIESLCGGDKQIIFVPIKMPVFVGDILDFARSQPKLPPMLWLNLSFFVPK
jgi:hypothetical protein